jgi:NAD(P)H dehydrogenase (quinone)
MSIVAIVYFSGYGHTVRQAEAVADGVRSAGSAAKLYRLTEHGDLPEGTSLEDFREANAIIYGSPTYMGGPAWQFKKFADASSKVFQPQAWKNKLAAGFTNSASISGDKFSTVAYFWTLAMQMGQVWVGTGLLPSSMKSSTPSDVNWSSGFGGAHAVSPMDASADEAPRSGDLETAKLLGKRVAELAKKLN